MHVAQFPCTLYQSDASINYLDVFYGYGNEFLKMRTFEGIREVVRAGERHHVKAIATCQQARKSSLRSERTEQTG